MQKWIMEKGQMNEAKNDPRPQNETENQALTVGFPKFSEQVWGPL